MKSHSLRNNHGVTLIEIIVAMAILMIVISAAYTVFGLGNQSFIIGNRQYDVQSDVRNVKLYIENRARFATSLEITNNDVSAIADSDQYDYIGLQNNRMIHSSYNNGSPRNNVVIGGLLLNSSQFSGTGGGGNRSLRFDILAEDQTQDFEVNALISLANLNLFNRPIQGLASGSTIKFKYDPEAIIGGSPVTPGNGGEDPTPTFVEVRIELANNSDNQTHYKEVTIGGVDVPWNSPEQAFIRSGLAKGETYIYVKRVQGNSTTYPIEGIYDIQDNTIFRINSSGIVD